MVCKVAICFAIISMSLIGCRSIRLDEVGTNGYHVEVAKQEKNQFDLSVNLNTPVIPNDKTSAQLNQLWLSEARTRCGGDFQGAPGDVLQIKQISGTVNAGNPRGQVTAKLFGVSAHVTCGVAG